MTRVGDGLRAAGRIVLFIALFLFGTGILAWCAEWATRRATGHGVGLAVQSWITLAGALVATAIMVRWIDRRPWSDLFLGREAATPRRFAIGLALGGLAIAIPSLLIALAHWLLFIPAAEGSWWSAAGTAALLLVPSALFEELLVRGYPFAVIRTRWGAGWAIGLTSIVFGLLHLGNPGARTEDILLVTLAGVFLGAIAVALRSLYAAWAAHFAWNFTMAALLHTAVSGLPLAAPDYRLVDAGPDWITGGPWGPEGGIGAALGMLGGFAYLLARHRRARGSRSGT